MSKIDIDKFVEHLMKWNALDINAVQSALYEQGLTFCGYKIQKITPIEKDTVGIEELKEGGTTMTQEDKQLQLVDMCARVPHHPKGRVVNGRTGAACEEYLTCATFQLFANTTNNYRLYLRPMSSMTEEEEKEYQYITERWMYDADYSIADSIDWLNAHHFDYRGLIEKGLALEASDGMYEH